ncbi:MAG: PilZ domain-containing protein [Burkholderiales bacterium]
MSDPSATLSRHGAISLNIREKAILYAAYMPFLKGGGIFVPTARPYNLGDEIFMIITLLDDPSKRPVAGKVVWITPPGAHGNRVQGVGVEFKADEGGAAIRNRIESLLGAHLKNTRMTHTM